jgi:hypothetical protein
MAKEIGFNRLGEEKQPKPLAAWEVAIRQFANNHTPVADFSAVDEFYTTLDLYKKVLLFYPSTEYTPADVANVMIALDFATAYHPVLKDWFWLLKPITQ